MPIKESLAALLSDLITARGQPIAETARELGMSRQRLHQLKTADRTAAPQAIEDAINKLGYEVRISAEKITAQPKEAHK